MPILSKVVDKNKILLSIEGSRGNSFGIETLQDLLAKLDENRNADGTIGLIITGSGKSFSVGGDVFAMHEALESGNPEHYLKPVVPLIEKVVLTILQYPKPIIAAINGPVAGGGLSLALACDDIVAVAHTKFGMAFGGLSLSPDSGSSVLFSHHFGRKETIDGISSARVYSAEEVEKKGIIAIVEEENLILEATSMIDRKTKVSPFSYGKTKLLVNQMLIQQLLHNLPLEYETILEAAKRDEFKDKVYATVAKLRKRK